ncbi:LexA family protein [Nesterenkonia sandarakina]|uniref:SOS response UmuD protein n=1 Tax=Nesterenkonia sandarakina TaxID=272918 RepID=A0A2T0YAU8_9MICC|nr:translesion error-prone DNA polymerase V autoproteolytic subunit [Nesterenkonia sandarakina]PRZ11831.1 SOS response UmuD protein [Nesterenkonia sandarakina]
MRIDQIQSLDETDLTQGLLQVPESVAAGFPSPAQDYQTAPINLSEYLIRDLNSTFLVRVSGDSMEGAGISDGDELIVDRSLMARDMSVVIAILDGEMTVKRLRLVNGGVVLQAENPSYPSIQVRELSELDIWGVVIKCIHNV